MALKIALNGFGRIGRCVTRLAAMRNDVELVAINDMASIDMLLYLLQNDSVHGSFTADAVIVDKEYLQIGKNRVRILCEKDPEKLDFAFLGADVVFECSGLFLSGAVTKHHLEKGVKGYSFCPDTRWRNTDVCAGGQ